MIRIERDIYDDHKFIDLIEAFVNRSANDRSPCEIYLVKIDHWFDVKWRGFQGKLLGAAGLRSFETLRIPPFIPDRVLEQRYFERGNGIYAEGTAPQLHFYQSSSDNLTRKSLVATSEPRLFVWYSGGTAVSLRGSVMAYVIKKSDSKSFYISLQKKQMWCPLKTDGISRKEATTLFQPIIAFS